MGDLQKATADGPQPTGAAMDATSTLRSWPRTEDTGDPFRTSLMALHDGVVLLDREGRLVANNPAAEEILGLLRDPASGQMRFAGNRKPVRPDGTPLPEESLPYVLALSTGAPQRDALLGLQETNGALTWILMHADPVFDPGDSRPKGVVCSFANVTDARHAQESLELAKHEAEESSRLKDKFVSLLAHDLRAPIAAAMSMVDLVASDSRTALSNENLEALLAVNERLKQQLTLIDEVLSITRLRTGKLRVHKRRLPAAVALSAAMGLKRLAEQKGVRLINDLDHSVELAVDPLLFGQVLQNLVSNSIKFTKPGGSVRIFIPPGQGATLAVQDTGVGIPADRLPDLFRTDIKTTTVGTAGERGTGMGLPLSHDIVLAHGGTLRIESEVGKGTTFFVDLPPHHPVVLVVDDEDDLRSLVKRYLVRLGCEVVEAVNGEEALQVLKAVDPALIVADVQMPKLDGFGLLDAVRRNPEIADVPVIIVTVGTDVETRDKAFALGANDFVTKPISPNDFVPRVRRFLT